MQIRASIHTCFHHAVCITHHCIKTRPYFNQLIKGKHYRFFFIVNTNNFYKINTHYLTTKDNPIFKIHQTLINAKRMYIVIRHLN